MIGVYSNELGFGNFLFVAATAFAKAIGDRTTICFSTDVERFLPLFENKEFFQISKKGLPLMFYEDYSFEYKPIPDINADYTLKYHTGYFQSPNYFHNLKEDIVERFAPSFVVEHSINMKYPYLKKEKVASVHVRRGNYTTLPQHHPVLPREYYVEAISRLPKDTTRIIVCSNDSKWCEENLTYDSRVIIHKLWAPEEHDGWNQSRWNWLNGIDMYLMSQCNYNIIANSTFSWWSGYLNRNIDARVFYPSVWFGPAYAHHKLDIIPDYLEWEKIDV